MIEQTPIYTALYKYMEEKQLRLHMPGHIGGRAMPGELRALAQMDVTEIPGLDDLHLSQGIIEESRRLLAKAFAAEESFFLVNGATSGIHALLLSAAGDGERILLPRNAHRSFYGGMVLSGAIPVYMPCTMTPELGAVMAISSQEVAEHLTLYPDVKAIFITNPSYYGSCSDLRAIVNVADRWGKDVLVDEAHGGHFPFHPAYPDPALHQGAAAVVNGLHKNWPVLNQGACLHTNSSFKYREKLRQATSLLTTTSPSYPILASIETARRFMEEEAGTYLEQAMALSREYKKKISAIKGLRCYGDELLNEAAIVALDPLKLLISTRELSLNGVQLASLLRDKYQIQLELESEELIMAMFSLLHEQDEWERFYLALKEIAAQYPGQRKTITYKELPDPGKMILSPRQAFQAAKQRIKLEESRGMIAGEIIAAYPPGIPCLLPGELISSEVLDYLTYLRANQTRIQGPEDLQLNYIQVIEQN